MADTNKVAAVSEQYGLNGKKDKSTFNTMESRIKISQGKLKSISPSVMVFNTSLGNNKLALLWASF